MNKIKQLWNAMSKRNKLVGLMFIQIWTWPQLFSVDMPANIGLPLAVTMVAGIIYNFACIIEADE